MTEPTGTGSTQNVPGDGQTPVGTEPGSDVITMTPAQLKERLERVEQKTLKQFEGYEGYKAAADELKKLKEKDLSEQELLKARIAEMEQAQADWDAQAKAAAEKVNEKLLRAEVRVIAATMNFIKPEQAYKLADLTSVETDEDGQVKGVKEALEALVKDNQHLIKAAGGPGSPANKPSARVTKDAELEKAVADARERFNIKDHSKQSGGKK